MPKIERTPDGVERGLSAVGRGLWSVIIVGKQLAMPGGGLANSFWRNPVYPWPPLWRLP